ncbi:MAG: hypothetical protein H0X66_02255 [Verrucomicrobia bacterium]|nr:hypothetical protein [Verrucomicrobiota bacterium]
MTLFLVVAIPTAILTALTAFFVYDELTDQTVRHNTVTARLVAKHIDEEFYGLRRYVESFAIRERIRNSIEANDADAIQEQLEDLVENNSKLSRAVITDTQGVLRFDYPRDPETLGKDFSHRNWFKGASQADTPYISEAYRRTALDQAVVVMIATKIRDPQGAVGYLGAHHAIEDLMDWLDSVQSSDSERIAIFDQYGNQMMRMDSPQIENISEHPDIQKALKQPEGWLKINGIDEFDRALLSHVPIPNLGWTVMAYQDYTVVFAPVQRLLRTILIFFLIALAAMGLLGWLWYRVLFTYAEDLRRSNRELENLCYSIAHDLRAPLRAMQGFTSLIAEDYAEKLGDEGMACARRVGTAAQRMDWLIRDLLEYGSVTHRSLEFERVDLSQSMQNAMEAMVARIQKKQAEIRVNDPLGVVTADKRMVQHLLEHLLSNALKYVARNITPKIEIWSEDKPQHVRLWMRDNGIGIPCEQFERIFGIFQRLHPTESYSGTGIGLAIVKKAAERMGGSVGLESEPDKGSIFWIELPKK